MKRSCLTPWQSIKIYFGENFFCSYLAKKKKGKLQSTTLKAEMA